MLTKTMRILAYYILFIVVSTAPAWAEFKGGQLSSRYLFSSSGNRAVLCRNQDNGTFYCSSGLDASQNLRNVTDLSFTFEHACVVTFGKVYCWGGNTYGQAFSPDYGKASQVVAGRAHTCALGDFGVKCWGSNEQGQINIPALKNPVSLTAGYDSTCAIEATGVKCWGKLGKYAVPELKNIRSLSVGLEHACAIADGAVKCWGDPAYLKIPAFKSPLRLNLAKEQTCVLDEGIVKCWSKDSATEEPVKGSRLVLLKNSFCFKAGGTLNCPALGTAVIAEFPFGTLENPSFDLDDLAGYLGMLTHVSSTLRSKVLQAASTSALRATPAANFTETYLGRFVLARIIAPAILSNDSTYGQQKLAPAFASSLDSFRGRILNLHASDTVPVNAERAALVWPVVSAALSAAGEVLPIAERETISVALRAVGQASADSANEEKRSNAVASINSCRPVWERLQGNPKTSFLAEILKNSQNWFAQ